MDFYVARAMRIFNLVPAEIDLIHNKENSIGRCLLNSEIQEMLKLGEIKDELGYGWKDEELREHTWRVKIDLDKVWTNGHSVNKCDVEKTHIFDKTIRSKKDDIRFYSEVSNRKTKVKENIEKIKSMEYLSD